MRKGFTLIELAVVLIVVGILASMAVASFSGPKERALGKEATANLKFIQAAEKISKMETGSYYISSNLANINTNLKLALTANNWAYAITSTDATSNFTATAARNGSGGYLECVYTITQSAADPTGTSSCP